MNFWENVEFILEKKDILKKELTLEIGISESAFSKGKQRNSVPDTALKISNYLGVSIESLLGLEPINLKNISYTKESLQVAHEYSKLSPRDKKIINTLLNEMKK